MICTSCYFEFLASNWYWGCWLLLKPSSCSNCRIYLRVNKWDWHTWTNHDVDKVELQAYPKYHYCTGYLQMGVTLLAVVQGRVRDFTICRPLPVLIFLASSLIFSGSFSNIIVILGQFCTIAVFCILNMFLSVHLHLFLWSIISHISFPHSLHL